MVRPAKRARIDSLSSRHAALNGQGKYSKTPENPWGFFGLFFYRKGHASNLLRLDKGQAVRDGCTASGLFGKPGCVCVCCSGSSSQFTPPSSWLCSTPIQSGTYGSKQPFREKKRAQKEKNKYFLISLSPVRPHWFFILLGRHQAVASWSLTLPSQWLSSV